MPLVPPRDAQASSVETLYRRELPEHLLAFSSPRGREIFRAALAHGTMEGWFSLAEQFHTQAEPAFCGLGSLVVALNALGVDPRRPWKGAWRWYSEELLDCCVPLAHVQAEGITLEELGCLARCNGVTAELRHADRASAELLRDELLAAARGDGSVVIASYARGALGQTGDGHFSPVGGVDAEEQRALVLDVARFKYPPHWVPIAQLHDAMLRVDASTGRARGWAVLRRRVGGISSLASLFCAHASWREVVAAFARPSVRWAALAPASLPEALRELTEQLPELLAFLTWRAPTDPAHAQKVAEMRAALRASAAGRALERHTAVPPAQLELATLILLVQGESLLAALAAAHARPGVAALHAELAAALDDAALPPELRAELELVRHQLAALARAEVKPAVQPATDPCAR